MGGGGIGISGHTKETLRSCQSPANTHTHTCMHVYTQKCMHAQLTPSLSHNWFNIKHACQQQYYRRWFTIKLRHPQTHNNILSTYICQRTQVRMCRNSHLKIAGIGDARKIAPMHMQCCIMHTQVGREDRERTREKERERRESRRKRKQ